MCIVFGLLSYLLFVCEVYAEDVYNDNGWRPISNEKIFNNLRRNFINPPETVSLSTSWVPIGWENTEENLYKDEPYNINSQLAHKRAFVDMKIDEVNQEKIADQSTKFHGNLERDLLSLLMLKNEKPANLRRAKKILEDTSDSDNSITSDISEDENKIIENKQKENENVEETNINNVRSTDYEVTEATEVKDLLKTNPIETDERPYFRPDLKPTESLTTKLFNILGDYNIRSNDGLTNYAMSRNRYRSHSYQVPIRLRTRYNSHNHFPIDPMLAVFLSNYGHYLPGLYGFPAYYNLYGYLASNNIHNNKPFGAYKIYSDTDSSH